MKSKFSAESKNGLTFSGQEEHLCGFLPVTQQKTSATATHNSLVFSHRSKLKQESFPESLVSGENFFQR